MESLYRSMHIKNNVNTVWNVGVPEGENVKNIAEQLNVSEFLAKLIVAKGFDEAEEARNFVNSDCSLLYDPFLMPDMDKAVERICRAVESKEKILIYGDYDVDGVTSVALLLLYLEDKGADVEYYIPERVNEGYGLNNSAIDKFNEQGVKLIITVDSGITAGDEVKYARENGIDTVITDHHECREQLPDAAAVVNPHRLDSNYPFQELAGVGVVFKLVCALEGNKNIARLCAKYCDIVALGTVADVMPIIGENRVIVKIGLDRLEKTDNLGLRALITAAFSEKKSNKNRKLTASSISFGLAPRINAAGRIGDVNRAVKLLITDNKQEAENIADYLCSVNRERQLIENIIFEQAVEQLESTTDFENDKVIVLTSDSWHLGVIGIVASKITERYGLPSILISFDGETGKGSGRSVKGFNINEAISQCKDCLIKYGGHELAAGLTISRENVELFRKKINQYAAEAFDFDRVCTIVNADFELESKDVTIENALEIMKLEPYGVRNPEPLFFMPDVTINEIYSIGDGKHLKLILEKDNVVMTAVYFGMPKDNFTYVEGMKTDLMFTLGYNDFRGNLTVQMVIKDIRPENSIFIRKKEQEDLFIKIVEGKIKCPEEHIPDLMNFRTIFTFIKNTVLDFGKKFKFSVFMFTSKLNSEYNNEVSPCMFNIALEVFSEMGLIVMERSADVDTVELELVRTTRKVDLNNSEFLNSIRN